MLSYSVCGQKYLLQNSDKNSWMKRLLFEVKFTEMVLNRDMKWTRKGTFSHLLHSHDILI